MCRWPGQWSLVGIRIGHSILIVSTCTSTCRTHVLSTSSDPWSTVYCMCKDLQNHYSTLFLGPQYTFPQNPRMCYRTAYVNCTKFRHPSVMHVTDRPIYMGIGRLGVMRDISRARCQTRCGMFVSQQFHNKTDRVTNENV